MNIGENIQNFRKDLGLSQEELAQKIPVSRQTVSQWENGQTVPSIDNLIILKEIFGVSVDEILGVENEKTIEKGKVESASPFCEKLPREHYVLKFSKEELKDVYRAQITDYFILPLIFTIIILAFALFVLFAPGSEYIGPMTGIFFGFAAYSMILTAVRFLNYRKSWHSSFLRICESTYEYSIYDSYLIADIYRSGEKVFSRKAFYSDIERTEVAGKWLFFILGGQLFILKKDELKEDSFFLTDIYNKKAGFSGKPFSKKFDLISRFLIFLGVMTFLVVPFIMNIIYYEDGWSAEKLWIYFLFIPVPLISLGFGILMKKKGFPFKRNIIAGVLIAALMCAVGCISFFYYDPYDPAESFELLTGIKLPEAVSTEAFDLSGQNSLGRGYVICEGRLSFDEDAALTLEKELASDKRWMNELPDEILSITSSYAEMLMYNLNCDYALVFNSSTGQYNSLPDENDIYYCVNALYDCESNQLIIIEYHIDYAK